MECAWGVCAASCAIFVTFFVSSCIIVDARSPKPDLLTAEQKKVALKIGGANVDKFIDEACEELRNHLAQSKDHLWNRPMQFLVRKRIRGSVPQVREWNDSTHGQEYLDDLALLLRSFPE